MEPSPITADMARTLLPARPDDGHKGTFGHVVVLGGSRRYPGAPRLAAWGALRSGVGLVSIATPTGIRIPIAEALWEAILVELPETGAGNIAENALGPAKNYCDTKQAVVLGPGLGTQLDTRDFATQFLRESKTPTVVDADALNAIADQKAYDALAHTIITPHPGEMARLLDITTQEVQTSRAEIAARASQQFECTVVLKGQHTVVSNVEGNVFFNPTGNVGMAKGGSGDVLAGLIGGLLAQGMVPSGAALLGVFAHGFAGDLAAERMGGRGMVARDIADAIPLAWQALDRT